MADSIQRCAHCREELGEEYCEYRGKVYCSEACAFEASLKINSLCGSRSSLETSQRFERKRLPPLRA